MSANVSIVTEERPGALIVPNWAIRLDRATGKAYVNLKEGGQWREVEIVAGVRNENESEVISGLAEGDVVVTGGIQNLESFIQEMQTSQ
jgi:HlyD family secretion protein